ncbi:hypothetical protein PHMEG_00040727 [Phytophthora megakarya]|uniref:CCHC-type domain-containing protein n=1 Tax=Phytophthora megakarya TaxID=4795 RepID=A0A225UE87_9STRA|nr:hypothetical protein PHMEG_00040727 [Phytophthora megakarya]
MLRTLSQTEQHGVALGFIMREQREVASAKPVSPGETPRKEYLKLRVSNYMDREGETLLRWLVELDTAVMARRLVDPLAKVAFAMSCLDGRARSYVLQHVRVLQGGAQTPQNEFRSRAEFLDLQQGMHDVYAYALRARYLISNVVTDPMDEATKVVTFMKGLRDGPVKSYLFREYPSTLEVAITFAMQEEFSLKQAKLHANVPRPPRPPPKTEGPEPMDHSYASAVGQQQMKGNNVRCFWCGNMGHYARECTAPVHSSQGQRGDTGYRHGQTKKTARTSWRGLMDFEEKHVPRSQLEVRLATGAIVKTEKR